MDNRRNDRRAFAIVLAGIAAIIVAAFALGAILGEPPLARFSFDAVDAVAGVITTAPLLALLLWFMRTKHKRLAAFRDSQIEFLAHIGFRFTRLRVAIMAIGAGVSEELLFRGVLQPWSDRFLPLWLAILLTNILFGVLHARTALYAVIAGLVGVYLAVIFEATDNLLAPILTHAIYDAVALEFARRALHQRPQNRIAE